MTLNSIGLKTDLFFSEFAGNVNTSKSNILIKTPNNPNYHWGNYIVFYSAPKKGDIKKWKQLFNDNFEYYKSPHHYSFTWDNINESSLSTDDSIKEFVDDGFEFETHSVLTTNKLKTYKDHNTNFQFKTLNSNQDWEMAKDLQIVCMDPKYANSNHINFKTNQMKQYQEMSKEGLGHWYGLFNKEQLISNLGIYGNKNFGRFQSISTHPNFRSQGACHDLLIHSSKHFSNKFKPTNFVIIADKSYHALGLYKSCGFSEIETNYTLSWWKK